MKPNPLRNVRIFGFSFGSNIILAKTFIWSGRKSTILNSFDELDHSYNLSKKTDIIITTDIIIIADIIIIEKIFENKSDIIIKRTL